MNILKITLNEDGDIVNYDQDFLIFRGGYGDITMQVEVPHSLLLDPVADIGGKSTTTGNNVKVGAIIRTSTGENIKTRSYEFKRVKDFKIREMDYRLYQRPMPKEFTLWETVSFLEETTQGTLEMVLNVSNWTINELGAKVEENRATHIISVDVHPSTNLDESEKIDNPSDLEILQSQVQNIDESLQNVEKDLYNIDEKGLGEYLLKRLIAGDKISIEKDTSKSPNGLKISLIPMKANEVSIDSIKDIKSNNVQDALEELSKRTDSDHIDTISAISEDMIDNTDPYNPIILHDPSKVDRNLYENKTEQTDANILALQNNKADLVDGKVPSSQLPSYVDDVLEYPTLSQLPDVGEDGKIYVTLDTNLTYRWGGTEYIEISPSLALGETASTAYRGDRGKIAYDHSQINGNPHNTKLSEVTEDATHRTVTDMEKQQWNRAEKNVQSDWNEDETTSPAYIKNKPNIPAGVQLYDSTGQNTNGSMTQKASTDEFAKYLPLTGGTMSGPIILGQGDAKALFLGANGRINSGTSGSNTIFGLSGSELLVGKNLYDLRLRGANTRPLYNDAELALKSDVISSDKLVTTDTAQTITATKTHTQGLIVSGRPNNSGDDEGIVITKASNNYAGLCLGSPTGARSVHYLTPDNSAIWRWCSGDSSNFDIKHPQKAGTVALTSDISTKNYTTYTVIDATSLDENTYYPVTFDASRKNLKIMLFNQWNGGTPSWATHSSKNYSCVKIWETTGHGWGEFGTYRRIHLSAFSQTETDPVRGVGQLGNSSTEYVYVRGGGKYNFYTSDNVVPVLRTESYTVASQTIAPTTTVPDEIVTTILNTDAKQTITADKTFTGTATFKEINLLV